MCYRRKGRQERLNTTMRLNPSGVEAYNDRCKALRRGQTGACAAARG